MNVSRTVLLGMVMAVLPCAATTYYVDSAGGNDGNSGTATNAAWQTLSKINSSTFSPGDFLLLKNGGSWTGTLNPKGSGSSGSPIILSSYGTNASRPFINGNGAADAVVLTNQSYWEISNLEVINPGSGTTTERRGIHLCAANAGPIHHLYVSNCYVHNICGRVDTSNGDMVAKRTGGIIVEVISDASSNTWFNDIVIQHCTVTAVTNQGIVACGNRSGGSDYPGTTEWNNRHCSNLIIRNNTISDVCKNAMSIRYGDDTCLVERNLIFNTANGTDGNMICSYGCRGTVFQYNEGYGNNAKVRDGCLYDADLRSPQTVWQYSYSHDNAWGLFCHYASADAAGDPFGNDTRVVVRYNISQNDRGAIFALSGDTGAVCSEYIYNNTIYVPTNLSPTLIEDRGGAHTAYFYNNIFYVLSPTAKYTNHSYNTWIVDYNVFYGQHPAKEPADAHKLTGDPRLVAPGTGGGPGGTNNLNTLAGYQLQAGSPAIDSGLAITTNLTGNPNPVTVDFFGVAVPAGASTDRGASEWIAAVTNQPPTLNLLAPSVLPNSATLKAQVNPGNAPTACYFEFGITTNYGSVTATNLLPAGTNSLAVSNLISELFPGVLYHYRACAANSVGATNTGDATFVTASVVPPQIMVTDLTGGTFQISFTNTPGASFSVLATTNLALARNHWIFLGHAAEIWPGEYQFADAPAGLAARFYQVRCP